MQRIGNEETLICFSILNMNAKENTDRFFLFLVINKSILNEIFLPNFIKIPQKCTCIYQIDNFIKVPYILVNRRE